MSTPSDQLSPGQSIEHQNAQRGQSSVDDAASSGLEPVECVGCGYSLKGLQPSGNCPECSVSIRSSLEYSRSFPEHRVRDLEWGLRCHVASAVVSAPLALLTIALPVKPLIVSFAIAPLIIFSTGTCKLAGLLKEKRTTKQIVSLALIAVSTLSLLAFPVALVEFQSYPLAGTALALAIPGTGLQLFLILVAHLQIPALLNPESQREPQATFPMATGALNSFIVLPGLCLATVALFANSWVAPFGVLFLLIVLAFLSIWILWLGIHSAVVIKRLAYFRLNAKQRAMMKW